MGYDSKKFTADIFKIGIDVIPKDGTWPEFSKFFDMDPSDLNNMAIALNYDNSKIMMDDSPIYRMYGEMGDKFIKALMESSLNAHSLGKVKVKAILDNMAKREIRRKEQE